MSKQASNGITMPNNRVGGSFDHIPTAVNPNRSTTPPLSRPASDGVPTWYSCDVDGCIDPSPSSTARAKHSIVNFEVLSAGSMECPVCSNTLVQDKRRSSM